MYRSFGRLKPPKPNPLSPATWTMATFSWSDTLKIAFKSCSSCLWANSEDDASLHINNSEGHNPAINNIPRARPDELQGLLADVDSDVEAERMSLHSNPGVGSQRKRKKNRRRSKRTDNARKITLFGYNLFGRRPPIQLADDSEDALYSRRGTVTPNTQSTSSSTFDSDAAPLGREAIAALSSPTTAAAAIEAGAKASAELEAQRLREKEERRRRRQERKERKRMAAALASQGSIGDGEFEGFQGSGGDRQTQAAHPRLGSDSGSESRQSSQPAPTSAHDSDNMDDTADLDGGLYSRKTTAGSSNGGSDSRSRTSASMSDNRVAHRSTSSGGSRQKTSSSQTAKSRSSNATTSQPPSEPLPSPRSSSTFSHKEAQVLVSPSTVEQGQGFFDHHEVDLHKQESSYIPITGFTSASGGRKVNSVGAFLAQRGDGGNESR